MLHASYYNSGDFVITRWLVVLVLFIVYEGFYLLPGSLVVLPGVFRISDAFFVMLPTFSVLFWKSLFQTFQRHLEESLLVISICLLMLISPLMAQIFFDQPYLNGLQLVRQNFFWLSFFLYIPLLRDIEGVDNVIRLMTVLIGIYVVILLLTKYFPDLGIIHFTEKYYSQSGSMRRFGDYRLFFPYGSVPIFIYCITLARLLYLREKTSIFRRSCWVGVLLIIAYAILSTYTRTLVSSLVVVTAFALITCKQRMLKFVAIALSTIFISSLVLSLAISEGDIPIIGDTKMAKMVLQSSKLEKETGRELQMSMYWRALLRSPLTGVGNLATRKNTEEEMGVMTTYRKYGFFNGSDLGYMKIAGESGLLGIAWVVWFFSYLYRSGRLTLDKAIKLGNVPTAEAVSRGTLYFLVYLMFTGFTFAHFVLPHGIAIVALSLALIAVTRVSVNQLVAANAAKVSG